MRPSDQSRELHRVSHRIAEAVREFVRGVPLGGEFTGDELDAYVTQRVGKATPGSATRILRQLRERRVLHYEVSNRAQARYRRLNLEPGCSPKLLDYLQRVAAGIAQSDACGGGRGHVQAGYVREVVELRAEYDGRLRSSLAAAGGARKAIEEMFSRCGWAEVEAGVWTPADDARGAA